ncbi:cupredoxin domain-containing protein [Actinacidiphila bryophytorum]|uniref:cupredoxin domain-containing protein n=1 Tax=Actinacidiphila bryophytorum TaxID=1436133 RepID=UPI002176DD5E|nr:cupredoxin family copper-binding protein [Actinacidiphila bryophytorum]UWE11194.1 cupredoxin family copper-binding protein [Actinacidiphila bryophytorum]
MQSRIPGTGQSGAAQLPPQSAVSARTADPLIRKLRAGAVAAALVGALGLLSACGGSGGGNDALKASPGSSLPGLPGASGTATASMPGMDMSTAPSSAAPTGQAQAPVSGTAVAIKGFAFSPASLTVKVGTKVTWTNEDSDAHTVTSDGSGGPLNSKAMNTGDTFSYTFTKPGTYKYLCTIHPFMTATVTVTQ